MAAVAGVALAYLVSGRASSSPAAPARPVVADAAVAPGPGRVALEAMAYARRQLGHPYEWGGTGPVGFDCSGLIYAAYRSAGVTIPRDTFDQWKYLRHVSRAELRPGDLILYAGGDGTVNNPGHVVMFLGGDLVIQAWANGYPVRINTLADVDAGELTGYARP
jgi:peptidoglycan DL-endopeptidase CwlO